MIFWRRFSLLFVLLGCINTVHGQDNIDSIFTQFDNIVYSDIYVASDLIAEAEVLSISKEEKAQLFKRKAIAARIKTKYEDALNYNLEALELFKKKNDQEEIAEIYHNMGFLMRYIENYEQSLEYFQNAINLRKLLGDSTKLAQSHREIGVIYRRMENFEKAKYHYDLAGQLFDAETDKVDVITLQGNYASMYFKQREYDLSIEMNKSAIPIIKLTEDKKSLATRYGNIATAYRLLKQYDQAITYVDSAMHVSREAQLLEPLTRYYYLKARIRHKQKKYRRSSNCMRKYKKLNDSLIAKSRLVAVEDQLKAFKYEKQILRDSIQTANTKALLENEVKLEKLEKKNILWISLLIGFILVSVLLWQKSRIKMTNLQLKNDQLSAKILESQLKTTTKENKRLINQTQLQLEFKKSIIEKVNKISETNSNSYKNVKELKLELLDQLRVENQSNLINESFDNKPSEFETFLIENYPLLTQGERRLCFLVRSGLNIKEISRINQTTSSAVQSMRYRIRKKMKLQRGQELQAYLNEIF
ncbi:MAG: tetratricopeptide repeat protein [Bacteroidota bacterium]